MMEESNRQARWWSIAIALVVAAAYYAANAWVTGPAYLADEIGYLTNAAFIAGHNIQGASSYHAGYSFLIAPLFYFFHDTYDVWQGVLVTNGLMWGAAIGQIHWIARRLFPGTSPGLLLFAVLLVACYPANVVMSGYAFSQSAVAFVFVCSVSTLLMVDLGRPLSVVPHAALVGLLFWVHPTGLVAPVASLLALLPVCLATRQSRILFVHVVVSVGLVLAYRYGIEPWRVAGMTPAGTETHLHYPGLGSVAAALSSSANWFELFGVAFGQMAYSTVATFGLTALAAVSVITGTLQPATGTEPALDRAAPIRWYALLAPLGCIALTSLSTAAGDPNRLDYWVYGRYQDAFILPLLMVGLLQGRRHWMATLVIAGAVCITGVLVTYGIGTTGGVNRVNISGLWPELWANPVSVATWLTWGAVGIVAFNFLPRYIAWPGAILLYSFSISSQFEFHKAILDYHSNPSEVVEFVQGNFDQGCVYFDAESLPRGADPASVNVERGFLYSYYFFNYHYQKGRNSESDWVKKDCRGALLTYDPSWIQRHPELSVVGIETQTGLRVLVKDDPRKLLYPVRNKTSGMESYWISQMSKECLVSAGCFHSTPGSLVRFTQVGRLQDDGLVTTGREGFLFFGPFRDTKKGTYEIQLFGSGKFSSGAYLDVAVDGGRTILMRESLRGDHPGSLGAWRFEVPQDVPGLEVRLWVGAADELVVHGYSVSLASPEADGKSASQ